MVNGNDFNGDPYLKISDLLLGAIINSKDLLTYEGKVFMVILFKTIGFQKEVDWLSYKQICKHTGIKHKTRISESVKSLVEKNLIIKDGKYFKVNQDFEKWLTLDKENINSVKEFYQSKKLRKSVTNDNEKLRNSVTEVMEKRNSKLRNSVTPSTDNIITDKINTDNVYRSGDSINDFYKEDKNKETRKQIKEIIVYLNEKAGKNFRPTKADTIKLITARLNEGFKIDDLKKVIEIKTPQWKDTEWDKYLRPKTLFGNKFEDYLNEKIIKKKGAGKNGYIERDRSASWFDEFQRRKSNESKPVRT